MSSTLKKKWGMYAQLAFIAYLFSNFIGMMLYFAFSNEISSLARSEQRDYYDGIDGVTYFCTAGLVLAFSFLINLSWGIKALIDLRFHKDVWALKAGAVVGGLWFAVYGICDLIARSAIQNGINHYPA